MQRIVYGTTTLGRNNGVDNLYLGSYPLGSSDDKQIPAYHLFAGERDLAQSTLY